jgi:hypothetical protein
MSEKVFCVFLVLVVILLVCGPKFFSSRKERLRKKEKTPQQKEQEEKDNQLTAVVFFGIRLQDLQDAEKRASAENQIAETVNALAVLAAIAQMNQNKEELGLKVDPSPRGVSWEEETIKRRRKWTSVRYTALHLVPRIIGEMPVNLNEFEPLRSYSGEQIFKDLVSK